MLIEYPYTQRYLFSALEAAPDLFDAALARLPKDAWDARPDPARFSAREVFAHLADWEPIFLARMERICAEEFPTLEGYDEGALVTEHDYAHADPVAQVRLFRERRRRLIAFLRARESEDWRLTGDRPEIGVVTLEALALLIPLHDTYHLLQLQQMAAANAGG